MISAKEYFKGHDLERLKRAIELNDIGDVFTFMEEFADNTLGQSLPIDSVVESNFIYCKELECNRDKCKEQCQYCSSYPL